LKIDNSILSWFSTFKHDMYTYTSHVQMFRLFNASLWGSKLVYMSINIETDWNQHLKDTTYGWFSLFPPRFTQFCQHSSYLKFHRHVYYFLPLNHVYCCRARHNISIFCNWCNASLTKDPQGILITKIYKLIFNFPFK
jgi:hypothetical protein